MADPLSISSGIAGLIALAGSIVSTCYSYGCAVKGGPDEIQKLVDEVMALAGVLTAVRALVDRATETMGFNDNDSKDIGVDDLPPPYSLKEAQDYFENLAEPVAGSSRALQEVQAALRNAEIKSEHRLGKVFKRLVWPLKREKTLELVTTLERYKTLYVLSLNTVNAHMTLDSQQTLNEIRGIQAMERMERISDKEAAKNSRIYQWLCPINHIEAHKAARRLYLQGTGEWMLQRKEWLGWWEADHGLLWLYGIPGSGKTVLMSTLLDHCFQQQNDGSPILYFYCDFRDKESQRPERVLGALIIQLASQTPDASLKLQEFAKDFKTHGDALSDPSFEELGRLFMSLLSQVPRVSVIVDALDECNDSAQLAQFLADVHSYKATKAKVLVSSRQEAEIEAVLSGRGCSSLRVDAHRHEIEFYVSCSMARTPRLRRLSEELRGLVKDTLVHGAQGMFRWAQVQIEALSRMRTDRDIRQALNKLPTTLFESYARILQQIEENDREVARRALTWLAYGPAAMNIIEVAEAVTIDSHTSHKDLEAVWDPHDVLSVIGGLARYSSQTGVVELAHHSVKEFLETAKLSPAIENFHLEQASAKTEIADTMLRYLLLQDFDRESPKTEEKYLQQIAMYPLFPLAARFWAWYAEKSISSSESTMLLAQRLFDPTVTHNFRNWMQVMVAQGPNSYRLIMQHGKREYNWRGSRKHFKVAPNNLTPLYYAASFGLLPVVQYLITAGAKLDERGGLFGGTPLHAAFYRLHTAVALLLIAAGADVTVKDNNFMTAMDMAVAYNRDEVLIKQLRAAGVKLSPKMLGQTKLG